MNVNVENLTACKRLLRFEIDVKAVDEAFESTTKDFAKQAKLPGFRPGKQLLDLIAFFKTEDLRKPATVSLRDIF